MRANSRGRVASPGMAFTAKRYEFNVRLMTLRSKLANDGIRKVSFRYRVSLELFAQYKPKAIVLLSFPSKAAAQAWRNDPELQDIHAMRNAGVDMTVYAFGQE